MTNQPIIQMMCPKLTCRRVLAVPASARGKRVRCRGCGSTIRVPQAKQATPTVDETGDDHAADASGQNAA